jgi:hypothetical protein
VLLTIMGPLSSYSGGGIWPQPSIALRGLASGATQCTIDVADLIVTGNLKATGRVWTVNAYNATSEDGIWIQHLNASGYGTSTRYKLYIKDDCLFARKDASDSGYLKFVPV